MRSVILSLCLFFACFYPSLAQTQEPEWQWQNPLPTGNRLQDVQFLDSQTGWAVGNAGTILKTTNGGTNWQAQTSGTIQFLTAVHFTNAQTGWVVGALGIILKTINGGQSWQAQNSGTMNSLWSVHFTDAQTGWAVGEFGTIRKTTNGGQTWQAQTSGGTITFQSVHFIDGQTGWAVGGIGTIRKTTNGGQTWLDQTSETTNYLYSIHFTDSQIGWAVGVGGTILNTTNGGQTWLAQISGTPNSLQSVHFTNAQTGWAVGSGGTILKTSNGGQTWEGPNSLTTNGLWSIQFTDAQTGWAVGAVGIILKTSNGGQSWQAQSSGTINSLQSAHFTDAQTGWAVGGNGTILKTSNGGQIWQAQSSGTTNTLSSVHFTDAQTGWAVGGNGTILKTSNGGQIWQAQSSGTTSWLFSVKFNNAQIGWAVGSGGTIQKTTNGGQTWQAQASDTTNFLYSIHFTDSQTGWAVGAGGTILNTTNGGQTWQAQSSGTTNDLISIHFTDAQTGWVVGNIGTIRKTTNGGQTWQTQSSGTTKDFRSVHFPNSQTGWAVGGIGSILKTNNGGQTWEVQTSGTTIPLYSVQIIDSQTGWAVGANGTILHYGFSGGVSPEVPASLVTGKLFEKTGTDCSNTSVGIPNGFVKAEPGPYYGVAKMDGLYTLRLPLADSATPFTLSPVGFFNSGFLSTTVCPPSGQITITVDTLPDTLSGNNFGFDITSCHHLNLQVSSNRRRRCFVNTTAISYWNAGSLPAPNAHVLVEFPHWVRPLSASQAHVVVNDSVWRFNLGEVAPGGWGNILIRDSVLCGNVGILGLSQCTKATIYPAPDCPPNNWSGAEVSVSGKCHNGFVELGIYNKTSTPMPDSVDYWVYLDSILVKEAKVKLAAGDSLKLWVEAFGMPVYLTANQVANHPSDLFVSTSIEACNDTMPFYPRPAATRFPIAQRPNSKTQCLPIIGAYDPNDKQVFPIGFTNQNMVAPGTRLEYLVRFQNTGNDTAFTVYVIDTLDQNLNVESFEMGAASHPFELSMQTTKSGKTFLRWQFNNILLPDSNTNEPASNGFVQFRISPKAGLPLGSKVRNHAEIYFDFNPPIITNQTLSTFDLITFRDSTLNDNVQVVTSADKLLERELGVKLYPNPVTHSQLTAAFAEAGSLTLYDPRGSVLYHKARIEGVEVLPISLKTGFYFATVETGKGRKSVKVVVE